MNGQTLTEEEKRLEQARLKKAPWRRWGPYLSERQWGTVREDYSNHATPWEYFPHDHARSRAYRWGEDGIAGISDEKQLLCFALSFWNGQDSILKERLFGLTGSEGNHGEDVKEYYFYLDNLPSHAYMKYLYKYPQNAFPYANLVEENRRRNRFDMEYELLDTGIFNENRYFDVFIEYAKETPEDILVQISVINRGPSSSILHLLPTLWFRNTWSWSSSKNKKPQVAMVKKTHRAQIVKASEENLGERWLYCDLSASLLFTENETNKKKLFGVSNDSAYVKDGIHEYLIRGEKNAVNPENQGTKLAVHHTISLDPGKTTIIKLRLSDKKDLEEPLGKKFDDTFAKRKKEAEAFYQRISPFPMSEDMRSVQRQAFAGLLWNKQCYHYNVEKWLRGDPNGLPLSKAHTQGRNSTWWNLDAYDIFSMPDKWEYPWFASWDLAFHTVSLATIDPDFAKHQLLLLTKEWYMHPSGQIPAYEWSFSDVNPPVHAWAAMRIYQIEQKTYGRKDRKFLEKIFQKLALNFTWWVNKKDAGGRNIFEGGFLGLDNIGAFDRTLGPPSGGILAQPDGTGWMGMYCLNLLEIAIELAFEDPIYEDMATKFFEHFIYIADAINNIENRTQGLWDEEKGFYYSLLIQPDGTTHKLLQNTFVGIIPLFAVAINHAKVHARLPKFKERFTWFIEHKKDLVEKIGDLKPSSIDEHILLSLVNPNQLKKILQKVCDETQFLSPHGIRSVSKTHAQNPFILELKGQQFRLDYEPAESTTNLFGGNSNWRGPIWFPLNYLLIESLQKYHYYLGDDFTIEYPSGSKHFAHLWDVAEDLSLRLIKIFLKDKKGERPLYGGIEKFQTDPHWRDYILFHEYFHGDNGAGLGASNQTGWTGLVAKLLLQYSKFTEGKQLPSSLEKEEIDNF